MISDDELVMKVIVQVKLLEQLLNKYRVRTGAVQGKNRGGATIRPTRQSPRTQTPEGRSTDP